MNPIADANERSESEINSRLSEAIDTGESVKARLMTDERVFARITDGIYRDPASALRELIANAYDADATEVRVETDYPRFTKISVRDNGRGLTKETLAHVICHIGGSLKRTKDGQKHQVSSEKDVTKSKSGRPLIGKLGIGLFSVSQITHHIVIISKTKNSNKRIYCDILLMPQSEALLEKEEGQQFVTGHVEIKFVDADDIESQGTEILLLDLRDHVKEALLSKMTWASLKEKEEKEKQENFIQNEVDLALAFGEDQYDGSINVVEPEFHIGEIDVNSGLVIRQPILPWEIDHSPREKFISLVERVSQLSDPDKVTQQKGPSIQDHLDYYLRMLWTLSLSLPLPYIKKHPFYLDSSDNISVYQIDNKAKGSAIPVNLAEKQNIIEKYKLQSGVDLGIEFNVFIDNIQILRPISFGEFHSLDYVINSPMMFIGRARPDLSDIPEQYRGGDLEFEGYLYWTRKIIPREHNGVLIRINGASGTLFDETFLKYQISEQTRLRQVSAEIFVVKGLDAALNIDRESFNIAHPHFQILKNWLHAAMRQLMNRHKYQSEAVNKNILAERKEETFSQLREIVSIQNSIHRSGGKLKEVHYSVTTLKELFEKNKNTIELDREKTLRPILKKKAITAKDKISQILNEEKAKSVASLLSVYGVDDFLPQEKFEDLVSAILEIMVLEIKK